MTTNTGSINVLLVEDNAEHVRFFQRAFSSARPLRMEMSHASRLSAALRVLAEEPPDLVLVDLTLPDATGPEVVRQMHARMPLLPIIALLDLDDGFLAQQVRQEGATDHLVKGQTDSQLLLRTVRHVYEVFQMETSLELMVRELQASEMRLQNLILRNSDSMLIIDEAGIVLFANPAAQQLFGRKTSELLNAPLGFPLLGGEPTELDILTKGSQPVVAEMRVVETEWEGKPAYLASLRDVTQRRRMEDTLAATARQYSQLASAVTSLSTGVVITDPSLPGNPVIFANPGFCAMTGYKTEEIIGQNLRILHGPGTDPEPIHDINNAVADCQPCTVELLHYRKDGTSFWNSLTVNPIFDPGGQIMNFVWLASDVTARKQSEKALRESQHFIQRVAEATPNILYVFDLVEGRIIYINSRASDILGYAPEDIQGREARAFIDLVHPDDRDAFSAARQRFAEDGVEGVVETEYRVRHADGATRWLLSRDIVFTRAASGAVRQILGTAQDITARKLAEEQATYQANLLQNVSDAIISTDIQFRIQSWNPAAERIYGWKAEEVLGKPLIEIVPTDFVDDRWNQESPARYLLENGTWTGEVLHGRRDGSVVHMYSSTTLIKDSAGRMVGVVSINHDTSEQELAEEARRKSEEQYRTLARNLPNGVVALFDTDLRYTLVEGAGMLGAHLSKESVEGKTVAEVFDGEERLEIEARYRNALAGIESITEMVYQDRVFQNYTLPVRNEHGEVFAGMSMSQDITERKRAEDALRLSEARYRAVIEEQNELVCRSLPDGRLSFVNDAYCRYFGKTREALIGANSFDLVYGEDREVVLQQAESLTLENPEATYEHRALAGSGIRWQQWNDRAIFDAEGNLVEYQSVGRDITEKKQAEEALRQSEARFRQMAENIHEVFYLIDPENRRVIYLNPAFDSTWGQPRQPFLDGTLKVRDTLHPEDAARLGPLYDEQYEKGTVVEAEYRVLRPDGGLCWIWDRSSPIRDSAGKFYRLVGTAEDITKRKLAEQARREVEERLLTIVNNAPVVIFALDRQANLTLFEGNLPGGLQLDRNTLIGRPIEEIYAGSPQIIENCRRALAGEAFTATVDTSTGRVFETYYAPLRDSDGTIIGAMGVATDITERRQAEEALRTSELRFRSLTETVPVGIGIIQGAGFVYVNPALQAIGGYSPEELLKMDFWERVHPDQQEMVKEHGFARMHGESAPTRYEVKLIARRDEERWVDTSVGLTEYDGKPAILITVVDITERKRAEEALAKSESRSRSLLDALPDLMLELSADGRFLDYKVPDGMALYVPPDQFLDHLAHDVFPPALVEQLLLNIQRALETGQVQTYEYQLAMAGTILDFEARIAAIPNENRLVLIARDITARRRSERELLTLNADLERRVGERTAEIIAANERLTELDYLKSKFISDVSHELRTPVMNLSMYLYLMEHDRTEKRARHLAVLKDQVIRLRALLENVLDLSRLDVRKGQNIFGAVDLNSIVEQVVFAHRPRTEVSGLALYCELAAGLPPVHGERNQLAQVVTNLLANAINYTPAGEIRISTTHDTARGHACLTVTDTGMGIAEEDLPHLFERFYRGRQASQSGIPGTGLGLGIVQEIVTLHGGQVEVESEIGRGSVFRVWLPLEGHQGADKADKDAGNGSRP